MMLMSNMTYGSATERPKSILLIILQALLSSLAIYLVMLQTLSVAGCDSRCDYSLVTIAFQGIIAVSIVLLAVSVVVVYVRGRSQQPSWWAPVAGIGLIAVCTAVAIGLVQVATT